MYAASEHALDILLIGLKALINSGDIEMERLKFIYGGQDKEKVSRVFDRYQLISILDCAGYVDRNTAQRIQMESDLFLVLSWNTKQSQGVLTGKFFEGIRAKKPILSVVTGEVPESELFVLNEKYQYGFCYDESMDEKLHSSFLKFICDAYKEKMKNGIIAYEPNPELVQSFRYDVLTKKLESMMKSLV